LNVDAEDFRRYYAELSDAALLDLDVDELVDAARQCYEVELAQRGLVRAQKAAEASPADTEMASVGEYTSFQEAELARMILESAEIPCRVENDSDAYGRRVVADRAFGAIRLLVPVSQLEDARECLASMAANPISDEELAKQAEAASDSETTEEQE